MIHTLTSKRKRRRKKGGGGGDTSNKFRSKRDVAQLVFDLDMHGLASKRSRRTKERVDPNGRPFNPPFSTP